MHVLSPQRLLLGLNSLFLLSLWGTAVLTPWGHHPIALLIFVLCAVPLSHLEIFFTSKSQVQKDLSFRQENV